MQSSLSRSFKLKTAFGAVAILAVSLLINNCNDAGTSPYPISVSYKLDSIVGFLGINIHPDSIISDSGAVTSYSVNPALPSGLSIDSKTGIISGTPLAGSAGTDYTITASGPNGSKTMIVYIRVNDQPARLMTIGKERFEGSCSGCHGQEGKGVEGAIPPFSPSDFLMADRRRAVRIEFMGLPNASDTSTLIHVNDSPFTSNMPPMGGSDSEVAGVLTYLRANFNNAADYITVEEVGLVRDSLLQRCKDLGPSVCNFYVDSLHH